MRLGFRFIHASWIWIYPRNFDLDFSTRLRPRFLHTSWTWICPRDFNLDSSTRLGFVDATWSCNYPRNLDIDLSTRLGLVHATSTWIYPRNLDLDFFLTQIGLGFGRFCSHPLLLDLDYFCLVHPIDPYVVTNRLTTSKSTSWHSPVPVTPLLLSPLGLLVPVCSLPAGLFVWLATSSLVLSLSLSFAFWAQMFHTVVGEDMGGPLQEKSFEEK